MCVIAFLILLTKVFLIKFDVITELLMIKYLFKWEARWREPILPTVMFFPSSLQAVHSSASVSEVCRHSDQLVCENESQKTEGMHLLLCLALKTKNKIQACVNFIHSSFLMLHKNLYAVFQYCQSVPDSGNEK